jgi:hypothetical protein
MTDQAQTQGEVSAQGEVPREGEEPRVALVDASNVAHSTEGEKPRLRNIELICYKLEDEGLEPVVVADAALRHQIDDTTRYEQLVVDGWIHQAPAGTDADYFILAFAREMEASIVSNDRFRDRQEAFPDARDRMIRYMILGDEVVLERRNRKR